MLNVLLGLGLVFLGALLGMVVMCLLAMSGGDDSKPGAPDRRPRREGH